MAPCPYESLAILKTASRACATPDQPASGEVRAGEDRLVEVRAGELGVEEFYVSEIRGEVRAEGEAAGCELLPLNRACSTLYQSCRSEYHTHTQSGPEVSAAGYRYASAGWPSSRSDSGPATVCRLPAHPL